MLMRKSFQAMIDLTRDTSVPIVRIVDDDQAVGMVIVELLRSIDIRAVAFRSPAELMREDALQSAGCLVLDVRLSGLSGLDFQSALQEEGNRMPVIVLTGYGDVPMSVRAMKAGAVDFLMKPFRDQDLIDAVAGAIEKDRLIREAEASRSSLKKMSDLLTPREKEIMFCVARGLMNKQIAAHLGISEVTVKLHRGKVMKKMEARTVADLVRKAETLMMAIS